MKSCFLLCAVLFASCVLIAAEPASAPATPAYSEKEAGAYLDGRLTWWTAWPMAARDHETFCVSCHTALPYALARPSLRKGLGESSPSQNEQKLLNNVTKRVQMWQAVQPFYPDAVAGAAKTVESRGTESILNALVLASYDAKAGVLSANSKLAFDNMWAQQLKTGETKGAWSWLQFHNAPFEGDSQFYGAALAAIAVGIAPGGYRNIPAIQNDLQLLRTYLIQNQGNQTLLDRVVLLWASTKVDGLLNSDQRAAILEEATSRQQADGGFSLSSFVGTWKRRDNTPLETKSDGYATGLVTYVLQQTGMKPTQPTLKRGLAWLNTNQVPAEGRWLAYSLNKQRDLGTDIGHFMSDAATAYAVMSLEQAR